MVSFILQEEMIRYLFIIVILLQGLGLSAQLKDSVQKPDTPAVNPSAPMTPPGNPVRLDSFSTDPAYSGLRPNLPSVIDSGFSLPAFRFNDHPFFNFTDPVKLTISERRWVGKEAIFYSLIGLLVFFALIRNSFPRYLDDLFKSYFRTTMKQRQIREQLVQAPLPSLLLNILFSLSIGMYVALLLQHFGLGTDLNFWLLYLYCVVAVAGVYAVKFVTLKFFGWIFQVREAAETYIFIVFTTNKIMGILLLPFLFIMAFSHGIFQEVSLTLSLVMVPGLLAYRYFLSFVSIRRMVKISFFHFILYLAAFEIAPVLLINKLLFTFLA
jgi:hypothetical protein